MTQEQLEEIGKMVDTADNYIALADNMFMTSFMKVDALRTGITELRKSLHDFYVANGGDAVWVAQA